MKHIIEDWDQDIYSSALWDFYFSGMRVGSLDIETTGLDPARCEFILGGLYDVQARKLHQVLAENRAEEAQALSEYMDALASLDVVITYNGRHFDIPFINSRLSTCSSQKDFAYASCDRLYDLDLYQVLSGHSPIRKLVPNMKQKTVENYMGLWETRTDEISGAESVDLYYHYEATGDSGSESRILLHNNDDIRQLTRLTKAVTKSNFHKAMYRIGFPVKWGDHMLTVNNIRIQRDRIRFSGCQNQEPVNYIGYEHRGWPVSSRFDESGFEISAPIIRQHGMAVVDLEASGITDISFEDYPECASGFLVIENRNGIKYRETNHFVKEFIKVFMEENL